jgi:hypothetical protein
MLSVKEIAGALKLDVQVVERLAQYLYPNKVLFARDEALALRDYYRKFGGSPLGVEIGPYNEWLKLERMKALIKARLESRLEFIEEKQSACIEKLNALAGMYVRPNENLPVKAKGYESGGLLKSSLIKFPASKKERGVSGLFRGLPTRD